MPTNTRSPSWIWRAAAATMTSWAVWSLIAVVDGHRRQPAADAQGLDVQARQVRGPIRHGQDPLVQPGAEPVRRARTVGIVAIERVVAAPVALQRRRVRPARLVHDRRDL